MVAASGVLGGECIIQAGAIRLGFALWVFAALLWLVLTYTIFTAFNVKENKTPLDKGISGAWLLAVVATQSIAVLAALLAAHTPQPHRLDLNFLALLIENPADAWFLNSIAPFMKGFTIFYWATGTWLIPMWVILAIWRHVYKRFPLAYDPLYWGAVFPLGMYAVATHRMASALHFDFLEPLPQMFSYIAMAAWLVTFVAFLRRLARQSRADGL